MKIPNTHSAAWVVAGLKRKHMQAVDRLYSLDRLFNAVYEALGISEADIKKKTRKTHVVHARQIFIYLARKYSKITTVRLGEILHLDHSTIVWSTKQVKTMIIAKHDNSIKLDVLVIENILQGITIKDA